MKAKKAVGKEAPAKKKHSVLIVYASLSGNTEKIAKAIGKTLDADLKKPSEVDAKDFGKYDLIGFGSGIYAFRFHQSIYKLIDRIPQQENKKAFMFATAGSARNMWFGSVRKALIKRGFEVKGQFICKGYDTFGPLKLIGGLNKGRPNEDDIKRAEEFAKGLLN